MAYGTKKPTSNILEAIGANSGKPNPPRVLEHTPNPAQS